MSEYAWMCLYKQDSEYALGPEYATIMNMAKFWTWQGFQCANITQHSDYARTCLYALIELISSKI